MLERKQFCHHLSNGLFLFWQIKQNFQIIFFFFFLNHNFFLMLERQVSLHLFTWNSINTIFIWHRSEVIIWIFLNSEHKILLWIQHRKCYCKIKIDFVVPFFAIILLLCLSQTTKVDSCVAVWLRGGGKQDLPWN